MPPQAAPHILAHRGLCKHAPENTLPAYAAAIALGFGLEIDVYQTADNHLVLIHDQTVDRTTDGTGKVVEMTLAELEALDAGLWFAEDYRGLRIPTFDDLLWLVKAQQWCQTVIGINMKTISSGIEDRLVDRLTHHGMTGQCFIFRAPPDSARRLRQTAPSLSLALATNNPIELRKAITRDDYDAILYNDDPTADDVEAVHAAGKRVWLGGPAVVDAPDRWANAKGTCVDGIIADHPCAFARCGGRSMARSALLAEWLVEASVLRAAIG